MADSCKLCSALCTKEKSIKKENLVPEQRDDSKLLAHVQIHRRHLRLVQGCTVSASELLEKCFSIKSVNFTDSLSHSANGNNNFVNKMKRSEVSKVSQNLTSYSIIIQQCRQILQNRLEGKFVFCADCGRKLILRDKRCSIRVERAIDHACNHLGKPLFDCRHCDCRYFGRRAISAHLRNVHSLSSSAKNFVDSLSNYQQEILDTIKRCFGQSAKASKKLSAHTTTPLRQSQVPLSNFCRNLFLNCNPNEKISCAECSACLSIFNKLTRELLVNRAIDHVFIHLGKKRFACRQCNHETVTKSGIFKHHLRVHKMKPGRKNYNDTSPANHDEIKTMLQHCFGKTKNHVAVASHTQEDSRSTGGARNAMISRAGGNTLLAARSLHCYGLVQKYSQNGHIKCRLCSIEIKISSRQNVRCHVAMQHALTHLNKPLYKCSHCSVMRATKVTIRSHNRRAHKCFDKSGYEDRCDDFQTEILNVLSQCYNRDQK